MDIKERRLQQILDYIDEENPNKITATTIRKALNLETGHNDWTTHADLDELVKRGHLKKLPKRKGFKRTKK